MKRHHLLSVLLAASLAPIMAQAQQRTSNPPAPLLQGRELKSVLKLVDLIGGLNGAWWTNTALVQRLGLTEDQKTRIQRAFENHRVNLESSKTLLEKEEGQLARLLEAETLDRGAILSQVDRVTQARSEMERTNSVMTLEMREVLTRAQWMQLPQRSVAVSWTTRGGGAGNSWSASLPVLVATPEVTVQRGGGARGPRGQQ
jgi:Spy/CpxP family protein refolding chaperone